MFEYFDGHSEGTFGVRTLYPLRRKSTFRERAIKVFRQPGEGAVGRPEQDVTVPSRSGLVKTLRPAKHMLDTPAQTV
jgi:hypothetical protein